MNKKGWLLGLLVSLAMLAGATPTIAGTYQFIVDLCNHSTITYNSNQLQVNGTDVDEHFRFDPPNTGVYGSTNQFTYTKYDDWSGKWTSDQNINFFIVKGGSCVSGKGYVALFAWISGDKQEGSFDVSGIMGYKADGTPNAAKVSHIDIHTGRTPPVVPVPGAVWLLGSGLTALIFVKRRKKQSVTIQHK